MKGNTKFYSEKKKNHPHCLGVLIESCLKEKKSVFWVSKAAYTQYKVTALQENVPAYSCPRSFSCSYTLAFKLWILSTQVFREPSIITEGGKIEWTNTCKQASLCSHSLSFLSPPREVHHTKGDSSSCHSSRESDYNSFHHLNPNF